MNEDGNRKQDMTMTINTVNKRQRIPKGKENGHSRETGNMGSQNEEKQIKNTTQHVSMDDKQIMTAKAQKKHGF